MKHLFLAIFVLINSTLLGQNTYRVGSDGDFQTLSSVNAAIGSTIVNGDIIQLKCGETFFGYLDIDVPNLTIESYGSGEKPIITGLKTLTNFSQSGNIWTKIDSDLPSNESYLTGIIIDGVWYRLGRYPDAGFLYFESYSSDASVTDNNASWSTNQWQGGEAVVRTIHYIYDRLDISSNTSNTLNFGEAATYPSFSGGGNNGFFIQNHDNTLSINGEWNFTASSDQLKIYYNSNLNAHTVQFPVATYGIYIADGSNGVTVKDIEVSNFYQMCFSVDDASNVVIDNVTGYNSCYFINDVAAGANTVTVKNCDISNMFCQSWETNGVSFTIYNNRFENIGHIAGLDDGGFGYRGLYVENGTHIIRRNTLKNIGYHGIAFYNSQAVIDSNFIDGFNMVLNDGGAIYTYINTAGTSTVSHNIIINGGNPDDGGEWHPGVGLYQDNMSSGITWEYNTLANVDYAFKENECYSGVMRYNKAFDIGATDGSNHGFGFNAAFVDHENFTFTNNVMVGNEIMNYVWLTWTTGLNWVNSTFDYNYWIAPWGSASSVFRHQGTDYSLSSWRSSDPFGNWDNNSKETPIRYSPGETYDQKIKHYINPTTEDSIITLSTAYTWIDIDGNTISGQQTISPFDGEVFFISGVGTGNNVPIVSNIPDQTIQEGQYFASINLNNYVSDADEDPITWSVLDNTNISVSINSGVATISYTNGWSSSETVRFRASDGLDYDEDFVTFMVNDIPDPIDTTFIFLDESNYKALSGVNVSGNVMNAWDPGDNASWGSVNLNKIDSIYIKYASPYAGSFTFSTDNGSFFTGSTQITGSWVNFDTLALDVDINQGVNDLYLTANTLGVWDLDWVKIVYDTTTNETPPLISNYYSTQMSCNNANDASIRFINYSGGDGSYSFSIDSGATYQTNQLFENLSAGNYDLVIKDGAGDSSIITNNLVVLNPDAISITASVVNEKNSQSNGSITLTGSQYYDYNWADNGSDLYQRTGLSAGTYIVIVSDSRVSCTKGYSFTISNTEQPTTGLPIKNGKPIIIILQ